MSSASENESDLYELIFNKTQDGIVIINSEGIVVNYNYAFGQIFGYDKMELLDKNINILMPSPHKEKHDRYLRKYQQDETYKIKPRRVPAIKKDNTPIFVELGVFKVNDTLCGGIVRDIGYLDSVEIDKLREAEERNMFATNISHELRTPLNAIINMNMLLEDDLIEAAEHLTSELYERMKDRIDTVKYSGTLLLTQINDILDYSKLIAGKLILRKELFVLSECIEACQKLHASVARDKHIEILTNIDPEVPDKLIGDPERLTQILVNLMGNAIKFTEHGKITVRVVANASNNDDDNCNNNNNDRNNSNNNNNDMKCTKELATAKNTRNDWGDMDYELKIFVSDTGIGIADDDRKFLFQTFKQIDGSHTKRYRGTGLGLVICKKLCQLKGGDIWLENSKMGEGSTFGFKIKFKLPAPDIEQFKIKPEMLNGKQILIVDDEPANLITYASYVLEWGMIPIQAGSGQHAMVYIQKQYKFDIAILDVRMSKMSGIQLAQKMRDLNSTYPIIALSSIGTNLDNISVFDDIVEKPITKKKLYSLIVKHMFNIHPKKPKIPIPPTKNTNWILVAEDNVFNQKTIKGILLKIGYINFDIVDNGRVAVEQLGIVLDGKNNIVTLNKPAKPYSIVLLDIKMPVMDGLAAAKIINNAFSDKLDKPKLIALTAVAAYGEKDFYIEEGGMDDYISKPIVNISDVRNTLAKYNY